MMVIFLFQSEKILKGGGTMVIGARMQPDGTLTDHMNGSLSNLNVWNKYLTADEVQNVYRSCNLAKGDVFYWCSHVINLMTRINVSMVSPSTACSASCKCHPKISL